MSFIQGFRHRVAVLLRRDAYARDIERELRMHLELEALAQTDGDDAARELAARRTVGNVTYYREEVRRMTLLGWVDRVRQDTTYALRGLRRSPGVTLTIVVTLALGFGVNAAMHSMIDQVFLRPPAGVVRSQQVHRLYEDLAEDDNDHAVGRQAWPYFTYPHYRALSAAAAPLSLAAFTEPESVSVVSGAARIPARLSLVTGKYFSVLGLRPARGRFFAGAEDSIEAPTRVAIISSAFWRRSFQADPRIVGRTLRISQRPVIIIGVAPEDFTGVGLDAVDLWMPANTYETNVPNVGPWYESHASAFAVLARIESPRDEARLLAVAPAALRSVHLTGYFYDSTEHLDIGSIVGAAGPAKPTEELLVARKLSWISLLVLLIASANVTNLLLLRAAGRKREIAVRRALGVTHARLCLQLGIEGLLLALLGGTAAVIVAFWSGEALRGLMLPGVNWASGPVDAHTLLFLVFLSVAIGLSAGLTPALQVMQPNLADSIRAGMRSGAYQRSLMRSALVVAQAALCVVLLVGAGLFLRSLGNIRSINLGYAVDNVAIFYPIFSTEADHSSELATALPQAAQRVSRMSGVVAAAYSRAGPMLGATFGPLQLPDRDSLPRLAGDIGPSYNVVSPDYFRATGLPIRGGRAFTASDNATSSRVVIVSERMARTFWPGTTALGKCLIVGKRGSPCSTVIGIAADAHRREILESPTLEYYLPATQIAATVFDSPRVLVVRALAGSQRVVARGAEQTLTQLLPGLDGVIARPMSDVLALQLRPWHLGATLFTAFGALALIVAAVGIYSVVASSAAQRTHEMGIRIALGASTSNVLDTVLSEGVKLLLIGVALGLAGALALGRFIASLLFGVTASDPSVLIGAAALLVLIALIASVVPGWRATRVDPAIALRAD